MKTSTFLLALAATVASIITAPVALGALSTASRTRVIQTVRDTETGERLSDGADLAAHNRGVHGTTFVTATDITRAEMRASKVFYAKPKGGTDVDVSNDADFELSDIGLDFIFVITSAGDSAQGLTVTDGASGVVVKRVNAVGTSCEDLTDKIVCTVTAVERIDCVGYCAD